MTNLYAHRDKNKLTFSIDADEIHVFLAILLLSGYNSISIFYLPMGMATGKTIQVISPRPRTCMYWESNAFVHWSPLTNIMSRNRFDEVMACFHLCDNDNLDRSDKMSKVRPFLNLINKRCLDNHYNLTNLSVNDPSYPISVEIVVSNAFKISRYVWPTRYGFWWKNRVTSFSSTSIKGQNFVARNDPQRKRGASARRLYSSYLMLCRRRIVSCIHGQLFLQHAPFEIFRSE